jgi:hypothetical protein
MKDLQNRVFWVIEVADALAIVVRGLSDHEREALRTQLGEAFAPFLADGGYALPPDRRAAGRHQGGWDNPRAAGPSGG